MQCYMKLTVNFDEVNEEVSKILLKESKRLEGNLSYENIERLINNGYKFTLSDMEKLYIISSIYIKNKSNEIIRYS